MKRLFSFLLLVFCMCFIYGQQDDNLVHYDSVFVKADEEHTKEKNGVRTQRYFPIGGGIAAHSSQDYALSPLTYTGNCYYIRVGHLSIRPKVMHQFNVAFGTGTAFTRNYPDNDNNLQSHYRGDIDYTFFIRVKYLFSKQIKLFAGPSFSTVGNMRVNPKMGNSGLTYELFTSLAASGRFQKDLRLQFRKPPKTRRMIYRPSTIRFGYQFRVPFATLGLRPNYLSMPDFTDQEYTMFDLNNLAVYSFGTMWQVNSLFEVAYVMENENMIKFGFIWDFYSYQKEYNDVKAALRGLYLSLVFNYN